MKRARGAAWARAWVSDSLSAFVVLSLFAGLLTPIAIQRRVDRLRDEIEHAADPGRTHVTEVQYVLARQMGALHGYYITRDADLLLQFERLVRDETALYPRLQAYAERLGPEVLSELDELQLRSQQWHDRLDEIELAPLRTSAVVPASDLPFEEAHYVAALRSASRLDEALLDATQLRRVQIAHAERQGMLLTLVLTALAIAASISVGFLSHRARQLARHAKTRQLWAEDALHEKVRATMARARLLRGVTHDVKNPLGAADAYAELLELEIRGPLNESQRAFLGRIRELIHSGLNVIGDLLDLERAEGGLLSLERLPTDIGALARDVAAQHQAAVSQAGHRLATQVQTPLPALFTDPARIRQILGNLLSNAIKYTPKPGSIALIVERAKGGREGDPRGWIAIRVIDSGPGIPEIHRETIFDDFQRLHGSEISGHGLGLAISRHIARLLQGEIEVCDAPAGGAEFVLRLPVDPRAGGDVLPGPGT